MGNANEGVSDGAASPSAAASAAAAASTAATSSGGFKKPTLTRGSSGTFRVRAGIKSPRKGMLSKQMSKGSMRNLDIQVGAALARVQDRMKKASTADGVEARVAFGSAQRLTRIFLRFGRIRSA